MRMLVLLILLFTALPAGAAVEPGEMLDDPALEVRARALSKEIRCLVCQSESIDTSNADLARDLRILVRERLTAGDTDQDVRDYLVARYGDYRSEERREGKGGGSTCGTRWWPEYKKKKAATNK